MKAEGHVYKALLGNPRIPFASLALLEVLGGQFHVLTESYFEVKIVFNLFKWLITKRIYIQLKLDMTSLF